jgi:hypothetical protein
LPPPCEPEVYLRKRKARKETDERKRKLNMEKGIKKES